MKEINNQIHVFLHSHDSGHALVYALGFLNLLGMLALYLGLQLEHLMTIKKEDPSLEVLKIKAIQQIKYDFYHQTCEDFTMEEKDEYVDVIFDDELQCTLFFYGTHVFQMHVTYDDVFLCIQSVEYEYEE